jgi:predicted Zn-dependent peptidase
MNLSPYQITTLDTGLRVATETLPGMESVSFCVSFAVGARHETPQQHGIAHLLEHMAFKGTDKRSARDIAEEFDAIGGHVNAYTSMDQTVYYARVLHRHLPVAVEILADILQHSLFDPTELEREQEVVLQEIAASEDAPEELVFDYLHEAAYREQPLGRSILGTPEGVSSFKSDDLRQFIATHYHTPAMVITAAGKVTHNEVLALVRKHFQHFGTQPPVALAEAQYSAGEKRVQRELEQQQLMLGLAAFALHDSDYPALQMISSLLGGGMSSRLFQEVREKRGLAYSVNAFLTSYRDTGMLGVYAGCSPERSGEALPVIIDEIRKLPQGVSEAELQRAKNQHFASVLMRRESPTSVAEWIARHLQEYGEYRPASVLQATMAAVTQADIARVATRLLENPQLTFASIGEAATLPDYSNMQQRLVAA